LSGIINGIDTREWTPGTDEHLTQPYNRSQLRKKQVNKLVLQKIYGLKRSEDIMVMGLVSRLVYQKGVDMLIEILPDVIRQNVQLVLLGSGDPGYEEALEKLAYIYPGYIGVKIGYDEELAHQIEAGSDVFLMPSRFEPCGLNQMYSQRYGTLPIVTPVGGLVDTVTDTTEMTILDKTATGFVMKEVSYSALMDSIRRALMNYRQLKDWLQLQRNAMSQDFSWKKSAAMYRDLYNQI
jgi:starch synthase